MVERVLIADGGEGRLAHLPALDGLRAIAVAAVVAYHLDAPWMTGGFLGVDLFFVISGFLITTLLVREREATDTVLLGRFWIRRFRRLVPPLVVTVAAVVAATRAWGLPEQWSSIRGDAIASLAYVANWRFVFDDQSYFETFLGPSPLLHTWSLAVEEQWYLVWPLVVVALLALRRPGAAPAMIVAGIVASATLMALGYDPADPSTVYFATHTRAQQLLVGALLAWLLHRQPGLAVRRGSIPHRVIAVSALVAFLAVAASTDDDAPWLYHGGFLVVSLVAGVLVWSTVAADGGAFHALTLAPLRWLGTRSYAVYLWHWPVIVFVGAPMGLGLTGAGLVLVRLAVTAALAEATHRLVERPLRNPSTLSVRRLSARPVATWSLAAVAIVAISFPLLDAPADRVLTLTETVRPEAVATPRVTTSPTSTTTPPATATATTMPGAGPATTPTTARPTTVPEPPPVRTMLLLGDSTAVAVDDFSSLPPEIVPGWYAQTFARIGCAITPGAAVDADMERPSATNEQCATWEADWRDSYDLVRPDVSVVMMGAWEVLDHLVDGRFVRYPTTEWSDLIRATYLRAIDIAGGPDGHTDVLLVQLPCMRNAGSESFPADARNDLERVAAFNAVLAEIAAADPKVHTVDIGELFCEGGVPIEDIDGRILRYDGVHVTSFGADLVWRWLAEQADAAVPPTP